MIFWTEKPNHIFYHWLVLPVDFMSCYFLPIYLYILIATKKAVYLPRGYHQPITFHLTNTSSTVLPLYYLHKLLSTYLVIFYKLNGYVKLVINGTFTMIKRERDDERLTYLTNDRQKRTLKSETPA